VSEEPRGNGGRGEDPGFSGEFLNYALYGSQQYRFDLAGQTPLRWITYTGTLAKRAAEMDGHEVQITRF
jgi:hypothetical protein